jgi:hypothetical protein
MEEISNPSRLHFRFFFFYQVYLFISEAYNVLLRVKNPSKYLKYFIYFHFFCAGIWTGVYSIAAEYSGYI